MSRPSASSPVRLALNYLAFLACTFFALFPLVQTARFVIGSPAGGGAANFGWFDAGQEQAGWHIALLALTVAVACVEVASALGYFFSRRPSQPGGDVLDRSPVSQILPGLLLLAPLVFVLWTLGLGWFSLWVGVVSLVVVLPFCTWQLKNAYDAISPAVEEAAALEGCTTWQKYVFILWPAALPALGWTALASFLTVWNAYLVMRLTFADSALVQIPRAWGLSRLSASGQWGFCATSGFVLALVVSCFLWLLTRKDEPRTTVDR